MWETNREATSSSSCSDSRSSGNRQSSGNPFVDLDAAFTRLFSGNKESDHQSPEPPSEGLARFEKTMKHKYNFQVIDPVEETMLPVSIYNGHSQEYYLGHPDNERSIRHYFDWKWPSGKWLPEDEVLTKEAQEKALRVSQQAMRYLMSSREAGIVHEPTGHIYLNPNAKAANIRRVLFKNSVGALPKLRYSHNQHFKMSDAKKRRRRTLRQPTTIQNAEIVQDETSSEEEETENEVEHAYEEESIPTYDYYEPPSRSLSSSSRIRNRKSKARSDW